MTADRLARLWQSIRAQRWLSDPRTTLWLWLLLPLVSAIVKLGKYNNFLIFRGVFHHTWQELPLYVHYPEEYFDLNHYGPFFSLIIAPFALVPAPIGHALWLVSLSLGLYWAIRKLPTEQATKTAVLWFCAHELLTALFMQQFNIAIVALVVGAWLFIEREEEKWAALCIVIGTFVKLYGVVGLAFFFFSKHKMRLIGWGILWSILALTLPMLISSPSYILGQYVAWYEELTLKNSGNMFSLMQNISLLGMVRKISGVASYSDLWLILPGLALFGLPYLRWAQFGHQAFRYAMLSSVLLFTVLFSTGSESSGYIIAFVGIALWYWTAPWQRSSWDVGLMVGAFILSSMSPSDLFPRFLRDQYIWPYALKALVPSIIWLKLVWEMCTRSYAPAQQKAIA